MADALASSVVSLTTVESDKCQRDPTRCLNIHGCDPPSQNWCWWLASFASTPTTINIWSRVMFQSSPRKTSWLFAFAAQILLRWWTLLLGTLLTRSIESKINLLSYDAMPQNSEMHRSVRSDVLPDDGSASTCGISVAQKTSLCEIAAQVCVSCHFFLARSKPRFFIHPRPFANTSYSGFVAAGSDSLKMLGTSKQTYSPKWCWKMVIYQWYNP